MREQQSKLIKLAAELVQGANLPSDLVDDYPQKTYSAGRVAQMMESPRNRLRLIGIDLRAISDSLSASSDKLDSCAQCEADPAKHCTAGRAKGREPHDLDGAWIKCGQCGNTITVYGRQAVKRARLAWNLRA